MSHIPPQSNNLFGIEFVIVAGLLALLCLLGGLGVFLLMRGAINVPALIPAPVSFNLNFSVLPTATPSPSRPISATARIPTPLPPGSALRVTGKYVGYWLVRVEKIVVAKAVTNPHDGSETRATGRFALVFLQTTNLGEYPQAFPVVEIQVIDSKGTNYQSNVPASLAASYIYGVPLSPNLQPMAASSLVLAYDLPLDGSPYYLVPAYQAYQNGQGLFLDIP